jgi:hypothetical protein
MWLRSQAFQCWCGKTKRLQRSSSLNLKSSSSGMPKGGSAYAVWTNARRILVFRVEPSGTLERLVEFDAEAAFAIGPLAASDRRVAEEALEYIKLLIGAARFVEFEQLATAIAVDERTFTAGPIPLAGPAALSTFIATAKAALDGLTLSALARLRETRQSTAVQASERERLISDWRRERDEYLRLLGPGGEPSVRRHLLGVEERLRAGSELSLPDLVAGLPQTPAILKATQALAANTLLFHGGAARVEDPGALRATDSR